tara:strand:- start:6 stop:548 length:543 start_codon:yes stop_codon:yes gene_type:complete
MSNYIIINNETNYFGLAESLRQIERDFGIDHSYLSRMIRKKEPKDPLKIKEYFIYLGATSEITNKYCCYLVYNLDTNVWKIYSSLRAIEAELKIDHSSLSKYLNGKKYKSFGAKNPGRPPSKSSDSESKVAKNDNEIKKLKDETSSTTESKKKVDSNDKSTDDKIVEVTKPKGFQIFKVM